MGYQIIDIETAVGENEIGLGTDFSFGHSAVFKTLFSTNEQQKARLKTLILTRKGERYNLPNFGTNLLDILFEPNLNELKQEISDIITGAVAFWLPELTISSVDVITQEDDATLIHQIEITINFSPAPMQNDAITISMSQTGVLQVS
jgi:phage baseplate assembly protein W